MRDREPEPREGCGGRAALLEREMLVHPARVLQICVRSLHCVPCETGHRSVSKQLGSCSVGVKEEREGSVTVLHPCRRKEGGRPTAFGTTDAVDVQNSTCL